MIKALNTYELEFTCVCPEDDEVIVYALRLVTSRMVRVERLKEFLHSLPPSFHEDIADAIAWAYDGESWLDADHDDVRVSTYRKVIEKLT